MLEKHFGFLCWSVYFAGWTRVIATSKSTSLARRSEWLLGGFSGDSWTQLFRVKHPAHVELTDRKQVSCVFVAKFNKCHGHMYVYLSWVWKNWCLQIFPPFFLFKAKIEACWEVVGTVSKSEVEGNIPVVDCLDFQWEKPTVLVLGTSLCRTYIGVKVCEWMMWRLLLLNLASIWSCCIWVVFLTWTLL